MNRALALIIMIWVNVVVASYYYGFSFIPLPKMTFFVIINVGMMGILFRGKRHD